MDTNPHPTPAHTRAAGRAVSCVRCDRRIEASDPATASLYDPDYYVCPDPCATLEQELHGNIVPPTVRLGSDEALEIVDHSNHPTRRPVACLNGNERISHQGRVWTLDQAVKDTGDSVVTLHLRQPGDPKAATTLVFHESRYVRLQQQNG